MGDQTNLKKPKSSGREVKLGRAHPAVVGLRGGTPFQSSMPFTPRTGVVALRPPRDPACGSQKSLLQRATSQRLPIIQATDPLICIVTHMYMWSNIYT